MSVQALGLAGNLAVTGASDGSIRVWETDAGRVLRQLHVDGDIHSAAISAEGKRIAVGDAKGEIIVIDVATGKPLWTKAVHSRAIWAIAFTPAGLASVAQNGMLDVRSIDTGDAPRRFPHEGITGLNAARFTPLGDAVVVHVGKGRIETWSVANGTSIASYRADGEVFGIDVAADGSIAASAEGRTHWLFKKGVPRPAREFHGKHECSGVAFSPDGTEVAIGCDDGQMDLFSVDTGLPRNISQWEDGHFDSIWGIAFSKDGRNLIAGHGGGLRFWDHASGALIDATPPGARSGALVASGSGRVATSSDDGDAALFDLNELRMIARFDKGVVPLAVDGAKTLGTTSTGIAIVSDQGDRLTTHSLPVTVGTGSLGAMTKGTGVVLSADGTLRVIDMTGERVLKQVATGSAPMSVATNATTAIVGSTSGDVRFVDLGSGVVKSEHLFSEPVRVAASSDAVFAATEASGTIAAWSTSNSDHARRTFDVAPDGIVSLAATDSGLLALDAKRVLHNIDPKSGEERSKVQLPSTLRTIASCAPQVVCGVEGGESWLAVHVGTGASVHMRSRLGEWVAWSDDGYFDASRGGGGLVAAIRNNQAFFVDQVALLANRPDVLLSRLDVGSPELSDRFLRRYSSRITRARVHPDATENPPDIHLDGFVIAPDEKSATVDATVRSSTPLGRLHIHINGVPVFGSVGKEISGQSLKIHETVLLASGNNRVEVSATTLSGVDSLRVVHLAHSSTVTKPRLWFLGFGVSHYADSTLNLQYADKDALDLAKAMGSLKYAFADVKTKTITNEMAVTKSLTDAKSFLAQASVDDLVVIFLAGHGVYGKKSGEYFYVTHDTVVKRYEETAAPFSAIESLIESTPARRRLVLIDTCESGERDGSPPRPGLVARGSRALAFDAAGGAQQAASRIVFDRNRYIESDVFRRTGAVVLSASRGNEKSYEDAERKNGTFTSVFLDGLNGAADLDTDLAISVKEIETYVREEVPKRTDDHQHPTIDRDNPLAQIVIPLSSGR